MIEKPAKDVKGCLLYNPFSEKYFFRVYDEKDKRKFVDYELWSEDISVTIDCDMLSLYEDSESDKNKLDWSSKYLK